MATRAEVGSWIPASDPALSIANALKAHWAEARKVATGSPFFRRSANWLEVSRHTLARAASHAAPAIAATRDVTGTKPQA